MSVPASTLDPAVSAAVIDHLRPGALVLIGHDGRNCGLITRLVTALAVDRERPVSLHLVDRTASELLGVLLFQLAQVNRRPGGHGRFDEAAVADARERLRRAPLCLTDAPRLGVSSLAAQVSALRARLCGRGQDLVVVVEGAHLLEPDDRAFASLRDLAQWLRVALIIAAPMRGLPDPTVVAADAVVVTSHIPRHADGRVSVAMISRCREAWSNVGASMDRELGVVRDDSGAALGWRLWEYGLDPGGRPTLVSPVRRGEWLPGVTVAHPRSPEPHTPGGLYAFASFSDGMDEWLGSPNLVLGLVRGWGSVLLHDDGWRSEFAQPVALITPDPARRGALSRRYDCEILHAELSPEYRGVQ